MHRGSIRGDIEWYCRKAVDSAGPALELGAGTGRITVPVAEAGVRVSALDLDSGMLAKLRQKVAALAGDVQARIAIFQDDMRSFTLDERFGVVIIPFRAFLHNLTWDDQLACLRRAHVHLLPGGQLAFNVFHPSLEYMAQYAGAQAGVSRWRGTSDLGDGRYLVHSEATRYDTVRQQLHSMLTSEEYGPEGHLLSTSNLRLRLAYLYPGDIARLLDHSGFELIRISGDFTGRPFEHDGDELVVEARRSR